MLPLPCDERFLRWAYFDWQLPGVDTNTRFVMELQPFRVNYYLWQETAAGVVYNGGPSDILSYQLGWIRGIDKLTRDETSSNVQDQDNFLARFNFNAKGDTIIGLFALYQFGDPDDAGTIYSRDYEIGEFVEDIEYFDFLARLQSNSDVGFELDAYLKYMIYKNLVVAINAG